MFTVGEMLKQLREPYRSQAIRNTNTDRLLDKIADSPYNALHHAFVWQDSPEGHKYWSNLSKELWGEVDKRVAV